MTSEIFKEKMKDFENLFYMAINDGDTEKAREILKKMKNLEKEYFFGIDTRQTED